MEYKIKDVCNKCNIGVSKFYNLKDVLINSIPEQNRTEYFFNNGRNFFITEKGLNWYLENSTINIKKTSSNTNTSSKKYFPISDNIISIYEKRIEYLENENKRLLDIISLKEQKEIAKDIKFIENAEKTTFWDKILNKFKK